VPRHIHIDPIGGIAGDMFAAALLDAWPALADGLVDDLRKAGLASDVAVRVEKVVGEVLAGSRFVVDDPREKLGARPPGHAVLVRADLEDHAHVPFREVRGRIATSGLHARVIERAQDIFLHLARAEAAVHGVADVDGVVFHEVGAMDSVADIVAAAILIERSQAKSWSCGPLPIGSGSVSTAHGVLPVPTPATQRLLQGLAVVDDGRPGERTTPTGAAIVKHLAPSSTKPRGVMSNAGVGWGTKRFGDLPNIVRVVAIDTSDDPSVEFDPVQRDVVCSLSFEIDDQSPEDLAIGLERVRETQGVVDVIQLPVFGKKNRMSTSIRVLCATDAEDRVVTACFSETTTLGVRIERIERALLRRQESVVDGVRVKRALRPGGPTLKAEADDVARVDTAHARAQLRRKVEVPR
jgi:uncharacterized protein (TIGR00299 family) protein